MHVQSVVRQASSELRLRVVEGDNEGDMNPLRCRPQSVHTHPLLSKCCGLVKISFPQKTDA